MTISNTLRDTSAQRDSGRLIAMLCALSQEIRQCAGWIKLAQVRLALRDGVQLGGLLSVGPKSGGPTQPG